MDINRSTLGALYEKYRLDFQRGLQSREDAMAHLRIATEIPSSTSKNVYPWLGQAPRVREWLGDRMVKRFAASKYEIENKDFEATVAVLKNTIEDDNFGVYGPLFEEMGIAAREWPAELCFGLLKLGESAKGYDDKPFFATDHPNEKEGPVSNLTAGASAPWYVLDTSRPIRPLIFQKRQPANLVRLDKEDDDNVFMRKEYLYGVDMRGNAGFGLWQLAHKSKAVLDGPALQGVLQTMRERTNDEGKTLGVTPRLLVVPPQLEWQARELLKAERNAAGATNVLNGALEIYVTNLVRE